MKSIKELETEIAKLMVKILEAEKVGKLMSSPGSNEFVKLIEEVRDTAIKSLASLDPHLPSLAVEYARHRGVKDTINALLVALLGYGDVLKKYNQDLLRLNGELADAIMYAKEKERNRI